MADDWESSFSSILDRTKENLSRINSRYAPQSQSNYSERAALHNYNTDRQANSSPIKSLFSSSASSRESKSNNNGYNYSGSYETAASSSFNQQSQQHRPTSMRQSQEAAAKDEWIQKISERLVFLEERSNQQQQQIQKQELHQQQLQGGGGSGLELKETVRNLERTVAQLQSKLTASQLAIEVMQSESDTKRSDLSKLSNSARQGDLWREDLSEQMDGMAKQLKAVQRTASMLSEGEVDKVAKHARVDG
jgi:hypothetical protein